MLMARPNYPSQLCAALSPAQAARTWIPWHRKSRRARPFGLVLASFSLYPWHLGYVAVLCVRGGFGFRFALLTLPPEAPLELPLSGQRTRRASAEPLAELGHDLDQKPST